MISNRGHSTGGLTGALYADARRDTGTIDALFLNSPFFAVNGSWWNRHVLTNLASAIGTVLPDMRFPPALPPLWAQSIHKGHRGEWDFRLDWKPIEGFPMKAGWVHAIRSGQARLQHGLGISAPVLVMFSTESSWPTTFSDVLYRTDPVLDVADIDRYADGIGTDVTKIRIAGGVHDLTLSAKPVRDTVYGQLFDWIRSRGR